MERSKITTSERLQIAVRFAAVDLDSLRPGDLLVRVRVATPHPSLLVASVSSSIQRAYAARNSASSVVSCCCTCAISLPAVA